MALRVLLADESTTIKKVMQLALQDFAVEVKAVHVGVDVVEVARSFQPDIVFADVLLQKKNGYEVSADLKNDPELRSLPVVLMWSSFMDLDEALATQCGADRRLEKPFDVEHLRHLILELVPKTRSQRIAHFLKFPQSVTESMRNEEAKRRESESSPRSGSEPIPMPSSSAPPPYPQRPSAAPSGPPPSPTQERGNQAIPMPPPRPATAVPPEPPSMAVPSRPDPSPEVTPTSGWNIDSFDNVDDFAARIGTEDEEDAGPSLEHTRSGAYSLGDPDDSGSDEAFEEFRLDKPSAGHRNDVPLEGTKTTVMPQPSGDDSDEAWSHQDLSRFKIDLPPVSVDDDINLDIDVSDDDLEDSKFLMRQDHLKFSGGEEKRSLRERIAQGAPDFNANEPADEPAGSARRAAQETAPGLADIHEYEISGDEAETQGLALTDFETSDASETPQGRELLPPLESGNIPQLSPERLEEIIRAQSREIIESVVRRIVPDLATDIIRQELERLLEDTSVREAPGREPRR